jgi:hypothetical protein
MMKWEVLKNVPIADGRVGAVLHHRKKSPWPMRGEGFMTLGEDLCRKYALTSLKIGGGSLVLLAINEALEAAAVIAEEQKQRDVASRIRSPEVV